MKPPKAGSRKAEVYEVFNKSGLEAAIEHGLSKGLKKGTIKSWSSEWAGGRSLPRTTKDSGGAAPVRAKRGPLQFDDFFPHPTHAAAVKHQQNLMRRNGVASGAYHILEQGGKFAVVPAHVEPGKPPPQFQEGDWVCDTIIPNTLGRIKTAGPQVCEVKYLKPRLGYMGDTVHISNVYLYKVDPPKQTEKKKKARTKIEEKLPASNAFNSAFNRKGKTSAKKKAK